MKLKFYVFLVIICQIKVAEAQQVDSNNFDVFVKNAIELSEQALYNATFDEALFFVDNSYFEMYFP